MRASRSGREPATIGCEPAVEIYAAGRGHERAVVYGFQHGGLEYVLVYATTTSRFACAAARVRGVRHGRCASSTTLRRVRFPLNEAGYDRR